MNQARSAITLAGSCLDGCLDAERLDVYHVAVEFQTLVGSLSPKGHAVLRDQLERASLSIVQHISEAGGRRSRPDKSRFYGIARGSANEVAAAIDLLRARGLGSRADCERARGLLVRIVQMLTKLQQRMAS